MRRKIALTLAWLLIGFIIYAILVSPDRAADVVQAIWDIIVEGFRNIGRFFRSLTE